MDKTTRFPLFVDMEGKQIIVFGGGEIATRRVNVLLDFGGQVTVISPKFSENLIELNKTKPDLKLIYKTYDEWMVSEGFNRERPFIVLAATDDYAVNEKISKTAREEALLVNVCDNPSGCDFYFPAILREDDMVVGIVGSGKHHGKVKALAARLRSLLQADSE